MAMMEIWAIVLITYTVSTATAMLPAAHGPALDMADDSIDDMYSGCKDKMTKVQKQYLQNEKNGDKNFENAWKIAENVIKRKLHQKHREQDLAIYVYTLNDPKIYPDFNEAVRTQKSEYGTKFKYHALHFFLTMAVQRLKSKECLTGYRRVDISFRQVVLNKEFRFGSFTSSSLGGYPSVEKFGDKSCFEIITCLGADISEHSQLPSEKEVLIPPYEVFKVTNIETRNENMNLPCDVVYKVKSTRMPKSNLNCALFQNME